MALKFADRTAESTVTVGTGDIMLAGAIDTDHDTFGNQFADGDTMPVAVFGGGKWMTMEARYNSGPNSLTRINFRDSSTGSPISLSGTMTVMCSWGAADAIALVAAAAASLRTDVSQSFNATQKNLALANVGGLGVDAAQALTVAQKTQALANLGGLLFRQQVFTTTGSATFTTPAGSSAATVYKVRLKGGGGGAGGTNQPGSAAGGAGEGAYWEGTITGLAPSTAVSLSIGAKGVGAVGTSGSGGQSGTATTLAVVSPAISISAGPGLGSAAMNVPNTGGPAAAGGTVSVSGATTTFSENGEAGCHGNGVAVLGGKGGNGGGGGSTAVSGDGMSAAHRGGGGGGAVGVGGNGGNGMDGYAIIEWVL